jgi:hypothetical protein
MPHCWNSPKLKRIIVEKDKADTPNTNKWKNTPVSWRNIKPLLLLNSINYYVLVKITFNIKPKILYLFKKYNNNWNNQQWHVVIYNLTSAMFTLSLSVRKDVDVN